MPTPDVGSKIGKAISEAPMGDLILSLATGIAEAQQKLDMTMLRSAILLTGEFEDEDGTVTKGTVKIDGEDVTLLELGFLPNFYHFTDTTIEVKISMSMSASDEKSKTKFNMKAKADAEASIGLGSVSGSVTATVSAVTTTHTSKFNYSAEASSTIRTRIVPMPAPALLEERLRRILDKKYKP